jgi:hypothetical protein
VANPSVDKVGTEETLETVDKVDTVDLVERAGTVPWL